jgi:hypothetical protein
MWPAAADLPVDAVDVEMLPAYREARGAVSGSRPGNVESAAIDDRSSTAGAGWPGVGSAATGPLGLRRP